MLLLERNLMKREEKEMGETQVKLKTEKKSSSDSAHECSVIVCCVSRAQTHSNKVISFAIMSAA